MKVKLKKIVKALCFLLGLGIIMEISSMIIKPSGNVYNIDGVEKKTESFMLEKENSLDIIFLGDSETYANFSPLHIWNKSGITSYVMGTSAQRLCDTYELLKRSVNNQDIKVILLETNCLYRNSSTYYDNDDYVMNKLSDVFPILKYHSRWENLFDGNVNDKFAAEERMYKGFRLRFTVEPYTDGEWMNETAEIAEIPEDNVEYLNKIKEFCEGQNIEFMLISAPSPDCWNYERHNAVSRWAEENAIDFLDLNLMDEKIGIDWETDTRDGGNHLNYYGAVKVSDFMCGYLMEKYDLTDHRNDPYYEQWNSEYDYYIKKVNKKLKKAANN